MGLNVKRCSSEGCTNRVVRGGVCCRHGAKVELKRCSSEGCTNVVVKGGVCKRHGAKVELKRCSRMKMGGEKNKNNNVDEVVSEDSNTSGELISMSSSLL